MPLTTVVSTRLLPKQERPAKFNFDFKWQVTTSAATFLPDAVFPDVLSQRRLHVVAGALLSRAKYTIIGQSRDEVMVADNSPSVSMWPYLVNSAQTSRLNDISVYAHRGTSRSEARTLYMNAGALAVWREMGMPGSVIGESNRPPWNAFLSFGMPFSR